MVHALRVLLRQLVDGSIWEMFFTRLAEEQNPTSLKLCWVMVTYKLTYYTAVGAIHELPYTINRK
ncbi:hypothetical protein DSM107003_30750 [Trichormus variabilis SAG 1403-4b]|uniref:Uncharacterized protein n=1 Tax=Trichormus variabilis SAG 1403-4b TaxID=447716 RepID=A0A433UNH6_ANAVA|nr:hypothetical protein DSM107003_30750 [Trichormus variabilis SAG 1403-4b]